MKKVEFTNYALVAIKELQIAARGGFEIFLMNEANPPFSNSQSAFMRQAMKTLQALNPEKV